MGQSLASLLMAIIFLRECSILDETMVFQSSLLNLETYKYVNLQIGKLKTEFQEKKVIHT